jgi:hypothetical protein
MLITDTLYHYQLFEQIDAHCRVRIYQHQERQVVVVTELQSNQDLAITNAWLELVPDLAHHYGLALAQTDWIEHYPQGEYVERSTRGDTFDHVTLEPDGPHWRRITRAELAQFIGEQAATLLAEPH